MKLIRVKKNVSKKSDWIEPSYFSSLQKALDNVFDLMTSAESGLEKTFNVLKKLDKEQANNIVRYQFSSIKNAVNGIDKTFKEFSNVLSSVK